MQPSPSEKLAEFTLKAVAAGMLLGIVFGAANAYLGLRVGMTVSASIPAAVTLSHPVRGNRLGRRQESVTRAIPISLERKSPDFRGATVGSLATSGTSQRDPPSRL